MFADVFLKGARSPNLDNGRGALEELHVQDIGSFLNSGAQVSVELQMEEFYF